MTVGERIAQKRKELGLSQEGLGERLGVSRQAIYKWESNASLPEIDKLVALSRIFSVTVGWLLGVEEPPEGQGEAPPTGELTREQLAMVEEIVSRLREERGLTETPPWTISYYPPGGPVGLIEFVMDQQPADGDGAAAVSGTGENLEEEA